MAAAEDVRTTMRLMREGDKPFVCNAWIEQMMRCPDLFGCPRNDVRSGMEARIARVMRGCEVKVLCDAADTNHLFGFIAYEDPDIVHWVYVKGPYRRAGLARGMVLATIGDKPIRHSHQLYFDDEHRNGKRRPQLFAEKHKLYFAPFLLEGLVR